MKSLYRWRNYVALHLAFVVLTVVTFGLVIPAVLERSM